MIGFSGKDRRQHKRAEDTFIVTYKLTIPLPVIMSTDSDEYPAVAMDVSEGGIGLDVDRPLTPETAVHLRFELANDVAATENYRRRSFKLDGQIRHCTLRDRQLYRVGVLFLKSTPEERDFISTYIKDLALLKR